MGRTLEECGLWAGGAGVGLVVAPRSQPALVVFADEEAIVGAVWAEEECVAPDHDQYLFGQLAESMEVS